MLETIAFAIIILAVIGAVFIAQITKQRKAVRSAIHPLTMETIKNLTNTQLATSLSSLRGTFEITPGEEYESALAILDEATKRLRILDVPKNGNASTAGTTRI